MSSPPVTVADNPTTPATSTTPTTPATSTTPTTPVLPPTATQAELLAQQIAALQAKQKASASYARNLKVGMEGTDVVSLQTFLEAGGFLKMPAGVAKGYFGGATSRALAAYQKSKGIDATGYFGPLTRASIGGAVSASVVAPAATANASTNASFNRDLEVGATGEDVKALQIWLNANGFTVAASGDGSAGKETTRFGNDTKAALIKYQKSLGISPAAGYFGAKTRAKVTAQ